MQKSDSTSVSVGAEHLGVRLLGLRDKPVILFSLYKWHGYNGKSVNVCCQCVRVRAYLQAVEASAEVWRFLGGLKEENRMYLDE